MRRFHRGVNRKVHPGRLGIRNFKPTLRKASERLATGPAGPEPILLPNSRTSPHSGAAPPTCGGVQIGAGITPLG